MKEEIKPGIQQNWRLSITTLKGETQNIKYESRESAQLAVNNKRVFGEISTDEWLRLTDLLSGSYEPK